VLPEHKQAFGIWWFKIKSETAFCFSGKKGKFKIVFHHDLKFLSLAMFFE
jgi:hypothetical protein